MNKAILAIEGTITSGLKEGSYFMSMEHYKKEIKSNLGFDAYPGTLNIKVDNNQSSLLKKFNSIKINGYKKEGKKFGGADCYKAKLRDIEGAIIVPDLTKHKEEIIEFIAPVHVKSKLNIDDGDKITIELL